MSDDKDDDSAGYKRPPKNTQFKLGQSGNPRGRPKGSRNLATLIKEELDEVIPVQEGGKTRRLSKREVLVKTQVNKALKGDYKATQFLITLDMADDLREAESRHLDQLAADDQAILEDYRARIQPSAPPDPSTEPDDDEKPSKEESDDD